MSNIYKQNHPHHVEHKHPKGLYLLFMVEMWERFSYYGMRALLVLYMTKFLMFPTEKAGHIYGYYTGLVYMTPLIGGYIADRYLGQRKCIVIGAILMALGEFCLTANTLQTFYIALGLLIIGNGFFKPNISTVVGQLYAPDDPRRDGAFTIFYMGINLGALMAPLICGTLGEKYDWRYGFGAAGVGMLLGLTTYLYGQNKYLGDIGLKPAGGTKKAADGTDIKHEPLTLVEKQRLSVIIILTAFSVFFWSAFEQAGSSLTLFADQSVNRTFFGYTIPTSYFQALNPLFIMILAPFFANMWVNLSEKGLEPRTPIKFIYGLSFLGSGFVLMILAAYMYKTSGAVSMLWMVAVYLMHTLGELCLSPVGLSTVTKLSPLRFVSVMMGVWLGSSFLANILGGVFAGDYDKMDKVTFFIIPTLTAFGSAFVLWLLSGKLKKWMHGIH